MSNACVVFVMTAGHCAMLGHCAGDNDGGEEMLPKTVNVLSIGGLLLLLMCSV